MHDTVNAIRKTKDFCGVPLQFIIMPYECDTNKQTMNNCACAKRLKLITVETISNTFYKHFWIKSIIILCAYIYI